MESILAALITGGITLLGVLIANGKSQAVVETKVEDLTREDVPRCRHPKYQIFQDPEGGLRFCLKATNGQQIALGGQFADQESCLEQIESMRKNAYRGKIEQEK